MEVIISTNSQASESLDLVPPLEPSYLLWPPCFVFTRIVEELRDSIEGVSESDWPRRRQSGFFIASTNLEQA
jgi:hypothetical protein